MTTTGEERALAFPGVTHEQADVSRLRRVRRANGVTVRSCRSVPTRRTRGMMDEPQIRGLPCRNCGVPVELAPDWRERVFDAVREANEALGRGTLDAAWAEAEAALPEGWSFRLHRMPSGRVTVVFRDERDVPDFATEFEATPAAALHALAARLRERQDRKEEPR